MRCGGVGFERQPGRAVGESHYNPGGAAEKLPRLAGGIGLVAKCLVLRAKHWEKVCWSYWMGTVLVNGRALGEATGYLDLLRCGGIGCWSNNLEGQQRIVWNGQKIL